MAADTLVSPQANTDPLLQLRLGRFEEPLDELTVNALPPFDIERSARSARWRFR